MGSSQDGGWASGGYQQIHSIPFRSGGFVPKIVGSPIIVGGGSGLGGGVDVGCVPVGFPPVGVPAVGIGGLGIRREPYVEVIPPLGVCYPGAVGSPLGVCYPGVGGPIANA